VLVRESPLAPAYAGFLSRGSQERIAVEEANEKGFSFEGRTVLVRESPLASVYAGFLSRGSPERIAGEEANEKGFSFEETEGNPGGRGERDANPEVRTTPVPSATRHGGQAGGPTLRRRMEAGRGWRSGRPGGVGAALRGEQPPTKVGGSWLFGTITHFAGSARPQRLGEEEFQVAAVGGGV